jgi:HEAT repeat protein
MMVKQNVMNLIEQLYDENANVRSQAVLAMGEMRYAESVDGLIHILTTETDFGVLEDATWALVRLGQAALEPVIALLTHLNPTVRHNAVHTLSKLCDEKAVPALITTLADTDDAVRLKAAFALGQIGAVQALPALIAMLTDEQLDVRVTVADVLEKFGPRAVAPLILKLQDTNWRVRDQAADILGRIGTENCVEPLLAALHDARWEVRFTVVNALREIGDTRAIEPVRNLLNDENPHVAKMASMTLTVLHT